MNWLNMIVGVFLYVFVGSLIGVSYALITGADMSSRANVTAIAGFAGPAVLVVIVAMRRLMRETDIQITRAIYHTLLITVAAPVLLYGAQLIAAAADAPKVARSFEVLKYWSTPLFFTVAVMYGIWRVIEGNRPRAISTNGRSGGSPPPSDDGSATSTELPEQAVPESLPGDEHSSRMVACFSSRGTPFRMVRRPA